MIDRQKLETVLTRRFPAATRIDIAAAANAIVALEREGRANADDRVATIQSETETERVAIPRRHPRLRP